MNEMMTQMNEQMAAVPQWVQYWMNWMMFIFLVSVVFVWKKVAARLALLAILLTMPIGMGVFYLSGSVHMLGVAHLIAWLPLLIYIITKEIKREDFSFKSIYGVWAALLMATIGISLIFDVRDIALVAMGLK